MCLDNGIFSNNIILITNNKFANKLTLDLVNKWNSESNNSTFKIIDLDNYSISTLVKYRKVKKEIDSKTVDDLIQKYDISSYPSILVLRNNNIIESIFGNYNNILEIVNFYL